MKEVQFSLHGPDRAEVDYGGYARIQPGEGNLSSSQVCFPTACSFKDQLVAYMGVWVKGLLTEFIHLEGGPLQVSCGVSVQVYLPNELLRRMEWPQLQLWFVPWREGPGGRIVRAISMNEARSWAGFYDGADPWTITAEQACERLEHWGFLPKRFSVEGCAAQLATLGKELYEPPPPSEQPPWD